MAWLNDPRMNCSLGTDPLLLIGMALGGRLSACAALTKCCHHAGVSKQPCQARQGAPPSVCACAGTQWLAFSGPGTCLGLPAVPGCVCRSVLRGWMKRAARWCTLCSSAAAVHALLQRPLKLLSCLTPFVVPLFVRPVASACSAFRLWCTPLVFCIFSTSEACPMAAPRGVCFNFPGGVGRPRSGVVHCACRCR